jgi:hypothetical protein
MTSLNIESQLVGDTAQFSPSLRKAHRKIAIGHWKII